MQRGAALGRRAQPPPRPALHRRQTGLLGRSLWGDIPFPTGPGEGPSLQQSGAFVLFRVWAALTTAARLAGSGSPGTRSLEGLGPGPHSRDQHTAHHCGHHLPHGTRVTDSDSFSLRTESLGPGWLQLPSPPWRRQGTLGGTPRWHSQWEVGCSQLAAGPSAPVGSAEVVTGSSWSK